MNSVTLYLLGLILGSVACVGASLQARHGKDRREFGLPGGWGERSPEEEKIKEVARFAADQIADAYGYEYHVRVGTIVKAESQVVGGMNYRIKVELEYTFCDKGTNDDTLENCPTSEFQMCTVTIHERAWENHREVTDYQCEW